MNSEAAAAPVAAPPPASVAAPAEEASERPEARPRPSLQPAATGESKRHVLDEDLHASFHNPLAAEGGRRGSLKHALEEPTVSVSEEDASLGDDDDDYAGASTGADSFCDASIGSEADPIYLSRGMSFTADGALVDLIDFYRKEITEGIDDDDVDADHRGGDLPGMIADHAIRQAQEGTLDDLSEDALEAEIRRQLEAEDAMRRAKLAAKKQVEAEPRATGEDKKAGSS